MTGTIRTEIDRERGVATLTIDHEARRNAMTGAMWDAIPAAVETFEKDDAVRVVVMRGAGDVAFVSGADISEFEESRSGDRAAQYDARNARAFEALSGLSKPLIAMIHGFAVGGGCAIALTADLRYCDEKGVFAIPAARLGLGYHAGGLENLVAIVGQAAAREIFFTARRLDAHEAHRVGLVNAVVPAAELDAHVARVANQIADNAPLTIKSAKLVLQEIRKPAGQRNEAAIAESIRHCYASADYAEGVRAFLEKRTPEFEGR